MSAGLPSALRLVRHGIVDSTNARALAAVEAGTARHGDLHVARGQTGGRGRRGRSWASPPGEGLYASLVLLPPPDRPRSLQPLEPAPLTMAAGLGVLDGLRAAGLAELSLKWPNDVVAPEGRKLAGTLVESRTGSAAAVVVGVGVNVRQKAFPPDLEQRGVTSLLLLGTDAEPQDVLDWICAPLWTRLSLALEAPGSLAEDYLDATGLRGERVRAEAAGGRVLIGLLRGIERPGGLLLATADGERRLALEHLLALRALPAG